MPVRVRGGGRVEQGEQDGECQQAPQPAARARAGRASVRVHGAPARCGGGTGAGAPPALSLARAANELAADLDAARRLEAGSFARLCVMEASGELTATQAKAVRAASGVTGQFAAVDELLTGGENLQLRVERGPVPARCRRGGGK